MDATSESAEQAAYRRSLSVRMRADLQTSRQSFRGRDCWVVKDPLALKYFRFEAEEFALLRWLDGRRSVEAIQAEFHRRFAPQRIAAPEILQFIAQLHRAGLVISDNPGQGSQLWERRCRGEAATRRGRWLQFLSIQFPGIQPERLLGWATKGMGWLFTRSAFAAALLLWIAAALLVATQWEELHQRIPSFREFFQARNWLWLGLTLAITKILHELGHGVACRRFGAQVHEMGLMLLVFTPCLYCNVSDSWMIPNKWRRIAIGAAGMYVEWTLAACCAFLWWFTQEGLLNQLALNTMFVSSVSTLAFNANPLLRYDGYYILSDWLEIPNLRQKSTAVWRPWIERWLVGSETPVNPLLPVRGRVGLAAYGIAAMLYRWLITFSIFFFLYKVLAPYGFQVLGQILAGAMVISLLAAPLWGLFRYVSRPGRWQMLKSSRVLASTMAVAGLLAAALAVPLPYYIRCPLYVRAANGQNVYVEREGRIVEILVRPNQTVRAGQPLVRLESPAVARELAELEGRQSVAQARLASSQRLLDADRHRFAADVATDRARLSAYTSLIEQRRLDSEGLIITAPLAGRLLAPDRQPPPPPDGNLPVWHGLLLDSHNVGAFADRGAWLAQIVPEGDPVQALLAVDQDQIEFIQPGQAVELWLPQHAARTWKAEVQAVSQVAMGDVPRCLAAEFGGPLTTLPDVHGLRQPRTPTYQVVVPLAETADSIAPGATGWARIRVGSRSLGARLWRSICQTVRFEL